MWCAYELVYFVCLTAVNIWLIYMHVGVAVLAFAAYNSPFRGAYALGVGSAGFGRGRGVPPRRSRWCRVRASKVRRAPRAFRALNGKPDLNGLWQAVNTANWDIQAHTAKAALQMRPGPVVPIPAKEVLALGAVGSVPSGAGVVEGDELPYTAEGLKKKQENQAELADARSRDQVLPPRRAARHLHAVSVSDHPEQRRDVHRV